ncbi:MAG TPA: hypothetical protein VFW25_12540 [Silvibacterium sp.]|nr:hypothetical protein [Silvibacterium sp.]
MGCVRVRFVAGPGFTGWSIRELTGSLFQHVEFGTRARTWIGAHVGGGIQERPFDYASYTLEYYYEIPCTDAEELAHEAWMRSRIGTKYNVIDIVGLMFQRRTLTRSHEYICSQFYADGMLRVFGAQRFLNVQADWTYRITPETGHLSPILVGRRVQRAA